MLYRWYLRRSRRVLRLVSNHHFVESVVGQQLPHDIPQVSETAFLSSLEGITMQCSVQHRYRQSA